eukprot:GHVS01065683.1.p1 GENE.GHVS01065683.1~~GHVS01065683.1.p1  ORF type:complete len:496 (-),score=67.08 GHVS01065683.1:350-1837(-)
MFVYLSLNKQSKMAAWASSRRVALWMTVSLLCVVYTLAAEDGGGGSNKHQKQKTPLLVLVFQRVHGKISVDGFVAALLYMKYINSKSKHQVKLIPHEGTEESARAIKLFLEGERKDGRDVTMVYLGVSPDVENELDHWTDGWTEYKMLEDNMLIGAQGGGGLTRVKVFDNHNEGFCKDGEDIKKKKELGFELNLDFSSTSRKIVGMIKGQKENNTISDEYGRLVEFAEFIEMERTKEGENAGKVLCERYSNVVNVENERYSVMFRNRVEDDDLAYFVALMFDQYFQLEVGRLLHTFGRTKGEFSRKRVGNSCLQFLRHGGFRDGGQIEKFVKTFRLKMHNKKRGMFREEYVKQFYNEFPLKFAFKEGTVKFALGGKGFSEERLFMNRFIEENDMKEKVRIHRWMENANAKVFVSMRRLRMSKEVVYSVRVKGESREMFEEKSVMKCGELSGGDEERAKWYFRNVKNPWSVGDDGIDHICVYRNGSWVNVRDDFLP